MIDSFNIINVSEYSYTSDFRLFEEVSEPKDVSLSLSIRLKLQTQNESHIQSLVEVIITGRKSANAKKSKKIVEYTVETLFLLTDQKLFEKFRQEKFDKIPMKYLRLVLNTSIGNTRGMMIGKLANTPIDIILPIINTEGIAKSMQSE